jgi:hypothetical protein
MLPGCGQLIPHNPAGNHKGGTKLTGNSCWLVREARHDHGGSIVRLKSSIKQNDGTCGEGNYCVQVHSRCASLVNEFCLDKQENNIADIVAAEELLRQTMGPCDFASTTVTLICDEGTSNELILQFDPAQN